MSLAYFYILSYEERGGGEVGWGGGLDYMVYPQPVFILNHLKQKSISYPGKPSRKPTWGLNQKDEKLKDMKGADRNHTSGCEY